MAIQNAGRAPATVLLVPGLRDHVPQHWQTLFAKELPGSVTVPPMGRENLARTARVDALEAAMVRIAGPVVLVAHSGGCITVAHWAQQSALVRNVRGALLAAPPDFDKAMPDGYPRVEELDAAGWLPVPRTALPFRSIVCVSRNDPLSSFTGACELAGEWGGRLVDLGTVGHLNPASGYGPWPRAHDFVRELQQLPD